MCILLRERGKIASPLLSKHTCTRLAPLTLLPPAMSKSLIYESVSGVTSKQHHDDTSIDKVVITIASSEEIEAISVLDVQPPYSEADQLLLNKLRANEERFNLHWKDIPLVSAEPGSAQMRPKHQLNHALMGSTEFNKRCATCNLTSGTCPCHFGSHSLYWPIYHIGFIGSILNLLKITCFFCSRITHPVLANFPLPDYAPCEEVNVYPTDLSRLDVMGNGKQWQSFWERAKPILTSSTAAQKSQKKPFCPHCTMPQPFYKIAHKDAISIAWPSHYHPDFVDENKDGGDGSHPWRMSEDTARHLSKTIQVIIHQYPDIIGVADESCREGGDDQCRLLDKILLGLLPMDPSSLSKEAKWLLKAIAFLNPSYRRRLIRIPMTAAKARSNFEDMSEQDVIRIGMHPIFNRPSSMIWSVMPIAPKSLRPAISQLSGTETVRQDKLTTQYVEALTKSATVRHQGTLCYIKTMRHLHNLVRLGRMGEDVVSRYNAIPPWQWNDLRACWLDYSVTFQEALSELQHEVSMTVSYKAVAAKAKQNHNSGKKGAKNATSSALVSGGARGGSGGGSRQKTANPIKVKSSAAVGAKSSSAIFPSVGDSAHHDEPNRANDNHNTTQRQTPSLHCLCHRNSGAGEDNANFGWEEAELVRYMNKAPFHLHEALTDATNMNSLNGQPSAASSVAAQQSTSATARRRAAVHQAAMVAATKIDGPYINASLPERTASQYGKKSKPVSLIDSLATKHGNFRQYLGKRSDFTTRKVLTANCSLSVDEVGVSLHSCIVETTPVKVTDINVELLQWMVANGSGVTCGADRIDTGADEGRTIAIPKATIRDVDDDDNLTEERMPNDNDADEKLAGLVQWTEPKDVMLEVGWIVHIYTQNGQYCIINRQPTLHRGNHTGHRSRRKYGRVFALCEVSMPPQNADTDGDAVTGSHRQSIAARTEVAFKMNAPNNIIDPRTHRPIITLHQNSLHGAFLLTQEDSLLTFDEVCFIVSHIKHVQPLRHFLTRFFGFARTHHNPTGRIQDQRDAAFVTSYFSTDDEMSLKKSCMQLTETQQEEQSLGTRGWLEFLPPPRVIGAEEDAQHGRHHPHRGSLWHGRDLMAMILPSDFEFKRFCQDLSPADVNSINDAVNDPKHRFVWISGGKWICGNGGNEIFGVVQNGIIQHIWRYYGKQFASDVMSDWNFMAHAMLSLRGATCGPSDVMLGGVMPSDSRIIMHHLVDDDGISIVDTADVADEHHPMALMERYSSMTDVELSFRDAVKRRKEECFSVLDASFQYVFQFMSSEDVHRYLVASDIKEARAVLESYASDMFKYMTSFTAYVTDESSNQVALMKNSGCKGSNSNSTTMAACMMLERIDGEQFAIGSRILPNSRIMPSEVHGSFTPTTLGVIRHSFVDGHSPDEMQKHSRATWEKVLSAARPEQSGYNQRKMKAHAESQTVHYDGTVRDGCNEIIQIMYGGDGYDAMLVMLIRLSPSDLLAGQSDISRLCQCDSCKILTAYRAHYISQLLAERCASSFGGTHSWSSADMLQRQGISVHITVNARVIVATHHSKWRSDREAEGVAFGGATASHQKWCAEVIQHCESVKSFTSQLSVPIDLLVHLLSVLHLNHPEFDYSLATVEDMKCLFHDIYTTYCESFAEPGTAVGATASQAISENTTQQTMRAFRMDVNLSKASNDDMDELLGADQSSCVSQCFISPLWASCLEDAQFIAYQMTCTVLSDWMSQFTVQWISFIDQQEYDEGSSGMEESKPKPNELDNSHPLYIPLQCAIRASYMMLPESQTLILPQGIPVLLFMIHPSMVESSDGPFDKSVMESRLSRALLPFQRGVIIGGPDVDIDAPFYWCMWHVTKPPPSSHQHDEEIHTTATQQSRQSQLAQMSSLGRLMMDKWQVMGFENIKSCNEVKAPTHPLDERQLRLAEHGYLELMPCNCYSASFSGSDLIQVMSHPAVVDRFCTSSNLTEIRTIFGVDEHAQSRTSAWDRLLSDGGRTYNQPRHAQLIVDTMTTEGHVTAINRTGLGQKESTAFIPEMAFENASSVTLNAALRGRVDPLQQNTGNIMYGKMLPFTGTGIPKVLPRRTTPHDEDEHGQNGDMNNTTGLFTTHGRDFNVDSALCSSDQLVRKYIDFIDRSGSRA